MQAIAARNDCKIEAGKKDKIERSEPAYAEEE
jgi:hypothetical protein